MSNQAASAQTNHGRAVRYFWGLLIGATTQSAQRINKAALHHKEIRHCDVLIVIRREGARAVDCRL
jgi:hypothetical protein